MKHVCVGKLLRNTRKQKCLTLDVVAAKADISKEYLCKVENGHVKNIGFETLQRVAGALEIDIRDLLDS